MAHVQEESGRHTVACGDCLTGERGGKERKQQQLGWQDRHGELLRLETRAERWWCDLGLAMLT